MDQPTMLLIFNIPRFMKEFHIKPVLEQFGSILDLTILRDKRTGESRGLCNVIFSSPNSAKSAQEFLHLKQTFITMSRPVEVKIGEFNERKLFIGMLSRKLDENGVRRLFSPYGLIEACNVLRDSYGRSRGCAFVTFENKLAALNAIKFMHRSLIMENCSYPINVRFADPNPREIKSIAWEKNCSLVDCCKKTVHPKSVNQFTIGGGDCNLVEKISPFEEF